MKPAFKLIIAALLMAGVAGLIVAMFFIIPIIFAAFLVIGCVVAFVILLFFIRIIIKFFIFLWKTGNEKNKRIGESK